MLRRVAQITVVLMLAIASLSAFMRHRANGVGCAPWPACYGQAVEPSAAVAAARLAHRVVASVALVLVLLAVMITLAGTPRRWAEGRLALALLALALALAVLGVYTPGSRVPAVAIGNLLGGFVMLALAARLALIAGRGPTRAPPLGAAAWLAAAVLSVQIVLGAQVSASHAGVACSGWGQCLELARAGAWDLAALDPWQAAEPGAPRGAFAQWLHRVGSVAAAAAVASAALAAWRRERRSLAATAIALTALLALFGWTQGAFGLPLAVVLLHNLGAAVLLALLVREA